jgi:hypothetical protein
MIVPVIIDQDDGLSIDVVDIFWMHSFQLLGHVDQSFHHVFFIRIRENTFHGRADVLMFAILARAKILALIAMVHVNGVMMISRLEACHVGTTAIEMVV